MSLANVKNLSIGVFPMFNILRFIVILVVAMIVFGWGVVAGQTDPTLKSDRRANPKAFRNAPAEDDHGNHKNHDESQNIEHREDTD